MNTVPTVMVVFVPLSPSGFISMKRGESGRNVMIMVNGKSVCSGMLDTV